MASSAYFKKLNSQSVLAVNQVQGLLEQLSCELSLSRPMDPLGSMITRLREMAAAEAAAEALYEEGGSVDDLAASTTAVATFNVTTPRKIISLLGGPLCGKTAQSSMACAVSGGLIFSAGELLEEAVNGGRRKRGDNVHIPEDLQQAVLVAMRSGEAATTEIMTRLFVNRVMQVEAEEQSQREADPHALVPRKTFFLDGYPRTVEQALALEAALGEVAGVILVYCPKSVLVQRMTNANFQPDDQQRRWRQYIEETIPLEEFWKAKKKLHVVDGSLDRHQCSEQVKKLLQEQ